MILTFQLVVLCLLSQVAAAGELIETRWDIAPHESVEIEALPPELAMARRWREESAQWSSSVLVTGEIPELWSHYVGRYHRDLEPLDALPGPAQLAAGESSWPLQKVSEPLDLGPKMDVVYGLSMGNLRQSRTDALALVSLEGRVWQSLVTSEEQNTLEIVERFEQLAGYRDGRLMMAYSRSEKRTLSGRFAAKDWPVALSWADTWARPAGEVRVVERLYLLTRDDQGAPIRVDIYRINKYGAQHIRYVSQG